MASSKTVPGSSPAGALAGRRELKKQALRRRLLALALEAIEREGYERVSIDALCQAAGVAKGTFFNHFPTKADLLAAWYADLADSSLEAAVHHAEDPADPWLAPVLRLIELVGQHPLLWAAKAEQATRSEGLAGAEVAADAALRTHYRRLLAESGDPGCSALHAGIIVAAITGSCREWLLEQCAAPQATLDVAGLKRRLVDRIAALAGLMGHSLTWQESADAQK